MVFVEDQELVQFALGVLHEPLVMRYWSRRLRELRIVELLHRGLGLGARLVAHSWYHGLACFGHEEGRGVVHAGGDCGVTGCRGLVGDAVGLGGQQPPMPHPFLIIGGSHGTLFSRLLCPRVARDRSGDSMVVGLRGVHRAAREASVLAAGVHSCLGHLRTRDSLGILRSV